MTVSLGGITLSDDLTLAIGQNAPGYSQRRLIGGASLVQADGSSGGRELILNSQRHMTIVQLEQIRALQATGQAQTLVHHRGTFQVLILDTSEMTEDDDYADPANDPDASVSGNITLLEV